MGKRGYIIAYIAAGLDYSVSNKQKNKGSRLIFTGVE